MTLAVRSAAAVNDEIRALLAVARGRRLGAAERERYERLRSEWLAAVEQGRWVAAA